MGKIELPIEEIIEKYESGMTQEKLAKEYGVCTTTISDRILRYYVKTKKEKPQKSYKSKELPMEEIIEKYESGMTQEKLAEEYGVCQSTIYDKIHKYYEKIGKETPKRRSCQLKEVTIEEIIEKYESGVTHEKLAEEYSVSTTLINVRINNYYKEQKRIRPRILKSESILIEYLKKGLSIEQIKTIAQGKCIIPDNLVNKALKAIESQENEHELD